MSTARLTALIGGIVTGCLFVFVVAYDASVPEVTVPYPLSQGLAVATGVFWVSYVAITCRDQVTGNADRNLARMLAAIAEAVDEAGDRRATQARVETLQHLGHGGGRRTPLTSVD
jgi:hypothetical protein